MADQGDPPEAAELLEQQRQMIDELKARLVASEQQAADGGAALAILQGQYDEAIQRVVTTEAEATRRIEEMAAQHERDLETAAQAAVFVC